MARLKVNEPNYHITAFAGMVVLGVQIWVFIGFILGLHEDYSFFDNITGLAVGGLFLWLSGTQKENAWLTDFYRKMTTSKTWEVVDEAFQEGYNHGVATRKIIDKEDQ